MATVKKKVTKTPAKKVTKKAAKTRSTFVIQLEVEMVSDLPVKTLHKASKWAVTYDGAEAKVMDACVYDQYSVGDADEEF